MTSPKMYDFLSKIAIKYEHFVVIKNIHTTYTQEKMIKLYS